VTGGARQPRTTAPTRAEGSARGAGFTLIELTVALAILGMLAATVALSLGGALAAAERIERAQEPYQRGRVARSFLASALRSAAPFGGFPEDGFVAVDSSVGGRARDELTFVALPPPGSGASRMQVRVFVGTNDDEAELRVQVRELPSNPDSLPPFRTYALTRGVAGLEIDYLGVPARRNVAWSEGWDSRIRLPVAVRLRFVPADVPDPMYLSPLVVTLPAGRIL
jgi:prepilin-type N-terminal cleavage/methylation domain-containing protein